MNPSPKLSIISPVYMGEKLVELLVSRLTTCLEELGESYEIILVEDGSPDGSWGAIEKACAADSRVVGLKLSRNFGQHHAITAGLDQARGEWIVVMDCDLQDQPEEIPRLYQKAQEGYDVVLAMRQKRQDSWLKKMGSRLYFSLLSYLTDTRQESSIANFGLYHQKVIQAILGMREHMRLFPGFVQWVGFRQTRLPVAHAPRAEGKTSYSFGKLLRLAIRSMLSFSDKPLRLTVRFGLLVSLIAFCYAIYTFFRAWRGEIPVEGWASLIVSVWFFSGVLITTIGLVGLYIGQIFTEVKKRPLYIVDRQLNTSPENSDPVA